MIWETHKIIFHHVFAFKNFSLYIIHAFKNIRLWVVEKCSTLTITLQSNLFTSYRLTDIYSQPSLHVLHLLLETSQKYHQQCACCKMPATLRLLCIITVRLEFDGKLSEWTGLRDERQQKWKCAEHSPLPAALWNPNCTTEWLVRALLSPELQRKCMKMSWCFDALAVKKQQMKAAIYPKSGVWCGEAFQLRFHKGVYYLLFTH